jgi:hypothetical protein
LYLVLSILVYAAILRKAAVKSVSEKVAVWWMAGIFLTLLSCGVYWGLQGALLEMFRQLVAAPLTTYAKTSSAPFPMFGARNSPAQNVMIGLFYGAPSTMVVMAGWLWARVRHGGWNRVDARLALALAWSALFYCQALTRSDLSHFLITLVPFLVLCAWSWSALRAGRGASVVAGCAVAGVLVMARPAVFPERAGEQLVDVERAGVRARNGAALAAFVRQVREQVPANRSILCLPYQPMLYFLCERRNPTRWNYLWPGDQTAEDHDRLIQEARGDPPALVLIDGEKQLRTYAPAIVEYVHRAYTKAAEVGAMSVYVPK